MISELDVLLFLCLSSKFQRSLFFSFFTYFFIVSWILKFKALNSEVIHLENEIYVDSCFAASAVGYTYKSLTYHIHYNNSVMHTLCMIRVLTILSLRLRLKRKLFAIRIDHKMCTPAKLRKLVIYICKIFRITRLL